MLGAIFKKARQDIQNPAELIDSREIGLGPLLSLAVSIQRAIQVIEVRIWSWLFTQMILEANIVRNNCITANRANDVSHFANALCLFG